MDLFDVSGQKLREIRKGLGWSRDVLCEKSGVPVRTIQDIENGTVQNPGVETIKRLIEAMVPKVGSSRAELFTKLVTLLGGLDEEDLEVLLSQAEAANRIKPKSNQSRGTGTI